MEFRSIRQTSHINGTNRNPGINEHNKALVWDNDVLKFKYVLFNNVGQNTKTANGYVVKGDDSDAAGYVWKLDSNKNPYWRKEEFLSTVARNNTGNWAKFTMNSGDVKYLQLGALAWLDSISADITLPGNTKILFDDNDTIGGDAAFTYDKTNKIINLTGFTGIQAKNNADSSYKGVLQYFGNKNILLAHGTTRTLSWGSSLVNNILIGEGSGGTLQTGQNNLFLGHYSGSNVSSGISNSIFIGPYSGALETANNKFYLGNTNYGTINDARFGSLLYGDLAENWLRINNRLEVPEEVRIGTFDVLNTPYWGMVQFIGTGNPDEYKPQYYDGFMWKDFASGDNYYLQAVTKGTADVGTTDAAFRVTFDMNGIADHVLQLGANAFNSTIIPQASVDLTAGLLQISSGDNSDSNRGFSSKAGLLWDDPNNELDIPGAIKLDTKAQYAAVGNVIIATGSHYYGRIGGSWIQLDNEPTSGQANELRFDGSIPTDGDITLAKDGVYLPVKGLKPKSTDGRVAIEDNAVDKDLDFSLNLAVDAQNYIVVGPTLTSANVFKVTDTPSGIAPTLNFRPLISTDDSVQFTITANDEIDISATGTGNPNTYTLANLAGAGQGIYDPVNSTLTNFKLKTLNSGHHIQLSPNANGLQIDIDVDEILLSDLGTGAPFLVQDGVNSFSFTQKSLINGTATTVSDDGSEVNVNVNKEIPKFAFTSIPVFTGVLGQGLLEFKSNYSADIRTSGALSATKMFELNIGEGLYYDSVTNTLKALSAIAATTDYRLTSITQLGSVLTFHMTDPVGGGAEQTVDYTLTVQNYTLPVASYTDTIPMVLGGVTINHDLYDGVVPITINESTGDVKFNLEPVLYTPQTKNASEQLIARTNTLSAYINGDLTEDFNANVLTADQLQVSTSTYATDEFQADVSQVEGIKLRGPHITSDVGNVGVYLDKRPDASVAASGIEVRSGSIAIQVNSQQGSGIVGFYKTLDNGTTTRIAYLDPDGNLHVKGDVFAFDTTV